MKRLFLVLASVEICLIAADRVMCAGQPRVVGTDRPNVLFIAIDDLNDWVGCLVIPCWGRLAGGIGWNLGKVKNAPMRGVGCFVFVDPAARKLACGLGLGRLD